MTLADFPQVVAKLPEKFQAAAIVGLRSSAARLVGYTVEEIRKAEAVATGELMRSVRSYSVQDGAVVVVEAPHARHVEWGTRPHWAPIAPLIDWARMKAGPGASDTEIRAIAFAVRAKIARDGTAPRRFFAKASARIKPEVVRHIVAEWNKITL